MGHREREALQLAEPEARRGDEGEEGEEDRVACGGCGRLFASGMFAASQLTKGDNRQCRNCAGAARRGPAPVLKASSSASSSALLKRSKVPGLLAFSQPQPQGDNSNQPSAPPLPPSLVRARSRRRKGAPAQQHATTLPQRDEGGGGPGRQHDEGAANEGLGEEGERGRQDDEDKEQKDEEKERKREKGMEEKEGDSVGAGADGREGEGAEAQPNPAREAVGFVGEPGVSFRLRCADTNPGQWVCIVGNHPSFGGWDVGKAQRLSTSRELFPDWELRVPATNLTPMPHGLAFEYKYVVVTPGDEGVAARWEPFEGNRRLDGPFPPGGLVQVRDGKFGVLHNCPSRVVAVQQPQP